MNNIQYFDPTIARVICCKDRAWYANICLSPSSHSTKQQVQYSFLRSMSWMMNCRPNSQWSWVVRMPSDTENCSSQAGGWERGKSSNFTLLWTRPSSSVMFIKHINEAMNKNNNLKMGGKIKQRNTDQNRKGPFWPPAQNANPRKCECSTHRLRWY